MPRRKTGRWSTEEVAILKRMFRNNSTQDVANELNRKIESVQNKASYMGLQKTRKYMKSIGLAK